MSQKEIIREIRKFIETESRKRNRPKLMRCSKEKEANLKLEMLNKEERDQ